MANSLREHERQGLQYIQQSASDSGPDSSPTETNAERWRFEENGIRSVGMHKVHGVVVQGIMGGILHQFARLVFLCFA